LDWVDYSDLAIELLEGKTVKTVERKSLVGERIILRPFSKRDLSHIQRWSTDAERVIGEAGLLRMFRPWRSTDMTIIIGERAAWRKGYGKEAARLLLSYAFEHLGFHRVSIGVVGFNKNALRFWKSLGFKKEGVERDAHFCDNKFSDGVMMSILENEYRESIENAT